ncbi:MAG: hypothetical protein HOP25_02885 [Methylotenera sp.]|nr:hypothetical protein [Methylotenera sp.]NOT64651.1 hypothetical protein [Methylotenera sp.]
MITKVQANTIASSILEQEHNARMQRKVPKRYKNGHILYRFKELKQFEAWERPLILMEAEHSVNKGKAFIWFAIVNAALALLVSWYILTNYQYRFILYLGFMYGIALMSPTFFFRRHLMKRYIHREVNLRKELGYGANSEVNQFLEWNATQS